MKIKLFTIPNLLTLSNLLCGMIATVAILTDGDLHLAFWLLVLAAVFDFFDGFTARLLHQSSPIGLQLDSLADMVSSGVAPTQRTEFCGLPSPAAGLFCASLGLLHAEGMLSLPYEAVLLAAAATAWLMISPIRMFALKFHGFGWTGNRLRYLFLGACVVLILTLGAYAIPAIFVLYVVVSLVRWLLQGRRAAEA